MGLKTNLVFITIQFFVKENDVTVLVEKAEFAADMIVEDLIGDLKKVEMMLKIVEGDEQKIDLTNKLQSARARLRIALLNKNGDIW